MAWYYVKSGGTATGDAGRATTERTGTFASMGASAYYDMIQDAFNATTPPAAGDTISASDLHNHVAANNVSLTYTGVSSDTPIVVQSVDDTAAATLKAGAHETTQGNGDFIITPGASRWLFYGMVWTIGDDWAYSGSNIEVTLRNCELNPSSSGDLAANLGQDGSYLRLEDCTLNFGSTQASAFYLVGGSVIEMFRCTTTGSASSVFFSGNSGVNGGAHVLAVGCDFSALGNDYLVNDIGGLTADDTCVFRFLNCRVPSGQLGLLQETPARGSQKVFEFIGVDNSDNAIYHYETPRGKVVHVTGASPYVTNDTDVEGETNYSYRVDTTALATKSAPFIWPLPWGYADMSAGASDVMRVLINTDGTPTDSEVVLKLLTPNSTNNTTMDGVTSAQAAESGTWVTDHTAAGSTLTTDTGKWDATNKKTNEYAVTCTAATVQSTPPIFPVAWLEIGYNTSTNELYVGTEPNYE